MRLTALSLAVAASFIWTGASAADATQPGGQSPTPAADQTQAPPKKNPHDPNEVICKRVEEIGSRLGGEKVCMTRAQWADEAWDNQHAMDDAQRHTSGVPGH